MSTTLLARQFYRHDPMLRLVRVKLGLEDRWVVTGVTIITAGVVLGIPILAGYRFDLRSFWISIDLIWLLATLIMTPMVLAVYLWVPNAIARLFNTLKDNGTIGERRLGEHGPESYEDFLNQLVAWTDNRLNVVVALMVVIAYLLDRFLVAFPATLSTPLLAGRPHWVVFVILLAFSPTAYAGVLSLLRLLVALIFTNRLFRLFHIRVNPLHPDGSGGLGTIGQMLTVSVLIATALGLTATFIGILYLLVGLDLLSNYEPVSAGVLYLVFTPLALIGWLWSPHQAMINVRNAKLQPLADEFLQTVEQSTALSRDEIVAIKSTTDKLAELKRRYELLKAVFPVWPIDIGLLSRLVAVASIPLISGLISSLVNLVVGLLK